jgi:hypothetical protein
MPFIVVYDATSLVGNSQRDLLFQVALAGQRVRFSWCWG